MSLSGTNSSEFSCKVTPEYENNIELDGLCGNVNKLWLISFGVFIPITLFSVALQIMSVFVLFRISSLRKNVKAILMLLSIGFAVIDVTFLVYDVSALMHAVFGSRNPFTRSFCVLGALSNSYIQNMTIFALLVLAIERVVDSVAQRMKDQYDELVLLGVILSQGYGFWRAFTYVKGQRDSMRDCTCACSISTISWALFATIFLIRGVFDSILMGIFMAIKRGNKKLLDKFSLTTNSHSLNKRYEQKTRVSTANTLFFLVLASITGNIMTISTLLITKVFIQLWPSSVILRLICTLTSHLVVSIYHIIHCLTLCKSSEKFRINMKKMIGIKQKTQMPNPVVGKSAPLPPKVHDYRQNVWASLEVIEKIWEKNGLTRY